MKFILVFFFFSISTYAEMSYKNEIKQSKSESYVIAFESQNLVTIKNIKEELFGFSKINTSDYQVLFSYLKNDKYNTLVEFKNFKSTRKIFKNVIWESSNFKYTGNPQDEIISNDPLIKEQFHHKVMKNLEAWNIHTGTSQIIVAVTDDGVDLDHEDLKDCIYSNSNEIPNNGVDDDQNGYIDDVNGWDFSSNDNNPRPGVGSSHGTHVAGIISSTLNNSLGGSGTAPNVRILPLRFYGSGDWTSTLIAKTYAYAADKGANIISTSYSIDKFMNDPIFKASLEYVYSRGVLHFNSAGNNSELNPLRQNFKELIFVCSTVADGVNDDLKSTFSNYGSGIDVCAPGGGGQFGILATVPNNKYERKNGTSMATPNAAATAALIWSYHPDWNREKVLTQLLKSSDDITQKNESYKDLIGSGRINSLNGLISKVTPPSFYYVSPPQNFAEMTISLFTHSVFDSKSLQSLSNWTLQNDGVDNVFGTLDDEFSQIRFLEEYKLGTNEIILKAPKLKVEHYRLTIKSNGIQDPFGNSLDGNMDGKSGDDKIFEFDIL